MEYNETGQLKQKSLHGSVGNGIQNLNYSYNIRGWLERINNPESTPSSTQKFNLGLYYNNVPSGISVNPQYNGNISAMAWNTPENAQALSPADKQGYGYSYDGLNRLTSAVYGEGTYFSTNAGANNESLTYDLNGNIRTLSRYKKGTGLIDNLTYYYKNSEYSNMLDRVDDSSGGSGFSENVQQSNEYGYDPNGNLNRDDNKGYASIQYNHLNLPKRIVGSTQQISYIYDAAGTKLAKIGTAGNYTWYAGGFVYNGSSLNYILTSEGMWLPGGSYNYYLKDHLGNTRLAVNTSGTVVQQTDYYPFGMDIAVYNGGLDNKYRYNGKEFQEDVINSKSLSWYDYGARFYDPMIGRWHTIDPLAEESRRWSSYSYCYNNPLRFIDPDGRKVVYAAGSTTEFKKAFGQAVQQLNKHDAGGMLAKLEKSDKVYYISETSGGSSFNIRTKTIKWDPTKGVLTNEGHELSPTTILNHEVDHALQQDQNPEQQKVDSQTPDEQYGNKEEKRVIEGSEQETAQKLGEIKEGEVTRKDHSGTLHETTSPTSTKWKNEIIVTPDKDEKNKKNK